MCSPAWLEAQQGPFLDRSSWCCVVHGLCGLTHECRVIHGNCPQLESLVEGWCHSVRRRFHDKYILFEAKLKARIPKESTPLNNIRWKKIYKSSAAVPLPVLLLRSPFPCPLLQVPLLPRLRYILPSLPLPRVVVPAMWPRRAPRGVTYRIILYISSMSSSSSAFFTTFCAFSLRPTFLAPVSRRFSLLFGHV